MTISHARPDGLTPDEQSWGPIVPVHESRREEAVRRLVGGPDADPEHPRRFLEFASRNRIDLEGMWCRLDQLGRIQATVLAVPNPGRTAMVFATRPVRPADVEPLGGLIAHAAAGLRAQGKVDLAQVLVEPADRLEQHAFAAGGFRHLADLSYLERPLGAVRTPAPPRWPDDVAVEPYDERRREEMIGLLEATYEDTLDCPGLLGLRRTEDILAGHQATGTFDPALWTILTVGGRPGGVLLLNRSAQGRCLELVYLGLAPRARGRGLGRGLVRHGLRLVRGRRERLIMLAVDDRNAPALRLYHGEGFRRVLRRVVLIRPVGEEPETEAAC